jgi:hypothetical protein
MTTKQGAVLALVNAVLFASSRTVARHVDDAALASILTDMACGFGVLLNIFMIAVLTSRKPRSLSPG